MLSLSAAGCGKSPGSSSSASGSSGSSSSASSTSGSTSATTSGGTTADSSSSSSSSSAGSSTGSSSSSGSSSSGSASSSSGSTSSGSSGSSGTSGSVIGAASLTGTLAFAPAAVTRFLIPYGTFASGVDTEDAVVTEVVPTCPEVASDNFVGKEVAVTISDSPAVTARTYGVTPNGALATAAADGGLATVEYRVHLPDGGQEPLYRSFSGSVTITSIDDGGIQGGFDVTVALFADGGNPSQLSGSFATGMNCSL